MAGAGAATHAAARAAAPDVIDLLRDEALAPLGPGATVAGGAETVSPRALALWLWLLGLASMLLTVPAAPGGFLVSFWALSYQRGYRARALPASVLQALGVDRVTGRLVAALSLLALLAALAALVHLAVEHHRRRPSWRSLSLGLLLVGAPVTMRSFGYELGALDSVLLALTLAGLLLLRRPGGGPLRWAGVATVATTTVLVHEAAVVLSLPVLLAAVVAREAHAPWRSVLPRVALVAVGPIIALAWVTSAPTLPRTAVPERVAEVRAVTDVDPGDASATWPVWNHTRDLGENRSYTADVVAERGHGRHLIGLAATLPALVAAAVLAWGAAGRRHRLARLLWLGVVLAPLALAPVGHDWGRWLLYAGCNGLLAAAWVAARPPLPPEAPPRPDRPVLVQLAVAMVLLALLTPPFARGGSFRVRVGQPGALVELLSGVDLPAGGAAARG